MLTINLSDGCFHALNGESELTGQFNTLDSLPVSRYRFDRDEFMKDRVPIAEFYDELCKMNLSGEQVIDALLKAYFPLGIFRVGDFEKLPLVIGMIGPRGSGKTCGAVAILIMDWLFRGLPVWSNVEIAARVCYKGAEKIFKSEELDKLNMLDLGSGYAGGAVFVDEINMEAGEATRSMSGANLQFSYLLQQIRKRKMSVVWTCQGFNWVDNRLRWQTDFAISCRDAFLDHSYGSKCMGDKSVWTVYDLSGLTGTYDPEYEMSHKFITDFEVWKGSCWNQPWWPAYSTEKLQGQTDYIQDFKQSKALKVGQEHYEVVAARSIPADELVKKLMADGIQEFSGAQLWSENGLTDNKSEQTRIGAVLCQFYDKLPYNHTEKTSFYRLKKEFVKSA